MGRKRLSQRLGLWMNGRYVGRWDITASGLQSLQYDDQWARSEAGRPLSLSMPLRPSDRPYKGQEVEAYFENLLPDNREIRQRIAERFRTDRSDAFSLLAEIGRDCVGALQILPDGERPEAFGALDVRPLTEEEVEAHLQVMSGSPAFGQGDDDSFRISLAGAQEKSALCWHEGRWCLPQGSTPTTHIFKLPMGTLPQGIDLTTSVENEWLCHKLLQAYGVPVARADILRFGETTALCVERFDRKRDSTGGILRLPQEDFCQAFALGPSRKYEKDGGPGIRHIMDFLSGSLYAYPDRLDFFRTQLVFWLLAAIDGHAKNFSVFIQPRGTFQLTPRYDVLSAHPVLGHGTGRIAPQKAKMAMAVWGKKRHDKWAEIRREHFEKTAADCGIREAGRLIDEIKAMTPGVVARVSQDIPRGFPDSVAGAILEGISATARKL